MPSPLKHVPTGETSEEEDEDDADSYERRRGAGIRHQRRWRW